MGRALHTKKGFELYSVGNGGIWEGCEAIFLYSLSFCIPPSLLSFLLETGNKESLSTRQYAFGWKGSEERFGRDKGSMDPFSWLYPQMYKAELE